MDRMAQLGCARQEVVEACLEERFFGYNVSVAFVECVERAAETLGQEKKAEFLETFYTHILSNCRVACLLERRRGGEPIVPLEPALKMFQSVDDYVRAYNAYHHGTIVHSIPLTPIANKIDALVQLLDDDTHIDQIDWLIDQIGHDDFAGMTRLDCLSNDMLRKLLQKMHLRHEEMDKILILAAGARALSPFVTDVLAEFGADFYKRFSISTSNGLRSEWFFFIQTNSQVISYLLGQRRRE